ncbi:family 20 glycosylhydrolase [Stenotrophomonas sp. MYb238]|uniref:family 20 glycosylhydrolase n=1 Tax=Stenotrophomonas sp. MYb238 TaxID=2040281 RepID=UPI001884C8AD|nr:family 20 glycosylhydrolase [Stenotrophomonas sp. MYb238]
MAGLAVALALAGCGGSGGGESAPVAPVEAFAAGGPPPLIPQPMRVDPAQGRFVLTADTRVVAAPGDAAAREAAARFVELVRESTGATLVLGAAAGAGAIVFATDPQAGNAEGYALEVGDAGVRVSAGDAAGLFYGGVSLWQLLGAADALPVAVPGLRIADAPRFRWRGFMLDSARHFQSVEEIKRLLDQMARHKLNTFHWHLTDDQGWRLEIKQYPKLTEVGAWRVPAGKAGVGAGGQPVRYGGFYTQAQAREVVEYARRLHITVVPEIEMPGHAQAAIAAYPEFGASGKAPPVSPDWGVHTWLYGVDDPTFNFLENVLTEVMDIFPGTFIHIGGDEADKYQWRNSPQVQAKREALGLKDDMALQSWFVKRIETFLVAHDRRLIGWDEILEGGLPPEATVMSWRGMKGAVEAAREGHDVVLSPSDITYINRMQSEEADEPPGHDSPISLEKIYAFEPVPPELDAGQARHVLGTQANLWTEHVRTEPRVEHLAFPRLSALAEVAWSPKDARDWQGFLHRLAPQMRRFAHAGIGAADSVFAARIHAEPQGEGATVALANQSGFGELRYTTDGSEPSAQSPLYAQPLQVALPTTVTANAFLDGQPLARPRSLRIDALALRTRQAEQLAPCGKSTFVLRLEDDEPLDGERAVVPVNIGTPCWKWPAAMLDGIAVLRVQALDLPYNFQFGGDSMDKPVPPAAVGELEVRLDGCDGPLLAKAQVQPQTSAVKQLDVALPPTRGSHDLCLTFAGSPSPVLWAIDSAQLLTAEEAR